MRRMLMILALVAVMLATIAAPVSAVPVSDLTAMARYLPSNTELLMATRTDVGFIETIDALMARIGRYVPGGVPNNLSQALEELSSTFPGDGDTFAEVFGPWLGDTLAFGIISLDPLLDDKSDNDDDVQLIVAADHRSREAVVTFFRQGMELENDPSPEYQVVDEGAYTLFVPERSANPTIYIDDDVLLVTTMRSDVASFASLEQSLATNERFVQSLATLPQDDYNALIYVDLHAIYNSIYMTMRMSGSMPGMEGIASEMVEATFSALRDAYGGMAWGFTILDGRSLTMDISANVDVAALSQASPSVNMVYQPLNPDFARFIEAGTPLVIHGSNLSDLIAGAIASAGMQMEMLGSSMDADQLEAQITAGVQGILGMSVDEAFAWMNSDYVLVLNVSPALSDIRRESDLFSLSVFPIDFGLIVDASGDPEAAQRFVSELTNSLSLFTRGMGDDVSVSTETIAGVDATVVSLRAPDLPMLIQIVIGASDEVFVFGTRDVAAAAFSGEGGLMNDPQYLEATTYALPGASSLAYAAGAGLQPLADLINQFDPRNGEGFQAFVNLLSSSSVTTVTDNEGLYQVRLVITLP